MRANSAIAALSDGDFTRWLDPLGPFETPLHLAVALSGGPDSSVLLALLQAWAENRSDVTITGLVVDHGLRSGSADEAAQVAATWRQRGVAVEVLTSPKPHTSSAIEEHARHARWALLEAWCHRHGVCHLFLGHHRDDQAETVLMRMAKGSGPVGLAGMAAVSHRGAMRVLRPLLNTDRAAIEATVVARGLKPVTDPTNADPQYLRNRMRQAAPMLAEIGLNTDSLCQTAATQRVVAQKLEREMALAAANCVIIDGLGAGRIDYHRFAAIPDQGTKTGLLGRLLASLGGHHYPVRRALSERAAQWLTQGFQALKPITLGGCLLSPQAQGGRHDVTVWREPAGAKGAEMLAVKPGDMVRWDGRFAITAPSDTRAGDYTVRAANQAVWSALRPALPDGLVDLPARLRWSLPALYRAHEPVAVLAPGYLAQQADCDSWSASFAPSLPMLRPY